MPKTLLASLSLALLLSVVSAASALPPEGPSGEMAFDHVKDGLLRYRAEKVGWKRRRLLIELAQTEDPRVAVALGEAMDEPWEIQDYAAALLLRFYVYHDFSFADKGWRGEARRWWRDNEDSVRRRAKEYR
jgi:hypothetical protein